jgi:hypothetical protein
MEAQPDTVNSRRSTVKGEKKKKFIMALGGE